MKEHVFYLFKISTIYYLFIYYLCITFVIFFQSHTQACTHACTRTHTHTQTVYRPILLKPIQQYWYKTLKQASALCHFVLYLCF